MLSTGWSEARVFLINIKCRHTEMWASSWGVVLWCYIVRSTRHTLLPHRAWRRWLGTSFWFLETWDGNFIGISRKRAFSGRQVTMGRGVCPFRFHVVYRKHFKPPLLKLILQTNQAASETSARTRVVWTVSCLLASCRVPVKLVC